MHLVLNEKINEQREAYEMTATAYFLKRIVCLSCHDKPYFFVRPAVRTRQAEASNDVSNSRFTGR